MKYYLFAACISVFGIVVIGCTPSETEKPPSTSTSTKQPRATIVTSALATTDQIRASIIGNSLEGAWIDKSKYNEFYNPNGTFTGYSFAPHNTKYSGSWKISRDEMCTRWELHQTGKTYSDCYQYVIGPDTVTLYKNGNPLGVTATVLPGNPFGY